MRFVQDLSLMLAPLGDISRGVEIARGPLVALIVPEPNLSKREPQFRRVGRGWKRIRVRQYAPLATGEMWISTGIYEWTRAEWIALWFRAMRTKIRGGRIPRAQVVNRGASK